MIKYLISSNKFRVFTAVIAIFLTIISIPAVTADIESKSHLVKTTTTILIENDGNTPITHHLIDCDERNGHSRLSHIVAKVEHTPVPVNRTDDGKWWRIDLNSRPIEPGQTTPLLVTKIYTHLELVPSHDVYLMPYSTLQYQVRIIKQGRPQKVKLPSEQYYLVIDNKDLVDLDETTSTVFAFELEGSTKIRFIDKNVIADEDFIQPESNIHIVNPSYMTMNVRPGNSWALQKFTDYIIEIKIFDENRNQIYPSDNLDIQISSSNQLVITNSTTNGTYHTIHTLASGAAKITAKLLGTTPTTYSFGKYSPDITLEEELNIYEPLEVKPSAIVLPWLPDLNPSYQIALYAAGGTGSYQWSSDNNDLTDISYSGDDSSIAKITTLGQGSSYIQCTDTQSSVFLRRSMITVAKIVDINIMPSITETELGGHILLPISVYANVTEQMRMNLPVDEIESGLVLFHDCSKIKFDVDIVEKTRFQYDHDEIHPNVRPKSCMSLQFTCNQPGSSRVWISYTDPTDPSSRPIKTTTVIACYKPLKPVYPSEVGVLALHTSVDIAFEGGPRPFGSRIDDHYSHIEPINEPILSIVPVIDRYRYNKDLHVFRVHCREYGEVNLLLQVGNQPSATLPNPASTETSMKIVCAKPDSVQLRPRLKASCPLNEMVSLSDTVVPISSKISTEFELSVFDEAKREFMNISSFNVKWSLSGPASFDSELKAEINAVAGYQRITRNYVTMNPIGREDFGRIQVDLHSYAYSSLYKGQTLDISTNLDVQFVNDAKINPNDTIVYNHRKNNVILSITQGSGYFTVEPSQGLKHANVSYTSILGQHRIKIVPLSIGRFSVRSEDLCIESGSGAPILSVGVVNVDDFRFELHKPGRVLQTCDDLGDQSFCLYLSVDRVRSSTTTTTTTTTRAPVTQAINIRPTPETSFERPTTTAVPRVAAPAMTFTSQPDAMYQPTMTMKLLGYLILFMCTASSLTIAYKWWQSQESGRQQTNPNFLRNSPSCGTSVMSSSFSPNSSRTGGPTSSTPRARPLFTQRFSSTLGS